MEDQEKDDTDEEKVGLRKRKIWQIRGENWEEVEKVQWKSTKNYEEENEESKKKFIKMNDLMIEIMI